jgi:hypothetical protein
VASKKKIVKIKGKYLDPLEPIFSLTTLEIFSYKISKTDCHLEGIILFCILCKAIIIVAAININNAELVKLKSILPHGCIGTNLMIENCSNVE